MTDKTKQASRTPDIIQCLRDWPDMCEQYSHRAALKRATDNGA